MTTVYSVPDMSCQHCVDALTNGVGGVPGVDHVAVDLAARTVTVQWAAGDRDADVRAAIDDAGYEIA